MRRHSGTLISGLLFITIGFVYLLEALDVWEVRIGRLWPILLVAVGGVILLGGGAPPDETGSAEPDPGSEV